MIEVFDGQMDCTLHGSQYHSVDNVTIQILSSTILPRNYGTCSRARSNPGFDETLWRDRIRLHEVSVTLVYSGSVRSRPVPLLSRLDLGTVSFKDI
jgi:hypothetical protein